MLYADFESFLKPVDEWSDDHTIVFLSGCIAHHSIKEKKKKLSKDDTKILQRSVISRSRSSW